MISCATITNHIDTLVNFKVVGSFEKQDTRDNIYCQLAGFMSPKLLYDNKTGENEELFEYVFDTASFTLKDTSKLEEFKQYLSDYGFSTPNSIGTYRTFIVVQDERANSSLGTLKQQIKYVNVLYPVLYILVGIIAVVVAYLMIVSRRKEYAIMRGLGADKLETFRSFFFEQIILCFTGIMAGIAAGLILYGTPSLLTLLLCTGFATCYIAGCILSASKMNKIPVLAVLKYED